MAQLDQEQIKFFLKQVVKYRFWILLSLSALLPLIGYFVGSGPIKVAAEKKEKEIKAADSEVGKYTAAGIPNDQWAPFVDEKEAVLSDDVNKAWEKSYARQAPLLKWPGLVEERFHAWGRKWPEDVDKGAVQKAIGDYVEVYDKAVDETYRKVNPWDPYEGTGIVVVPDKVSLLHPAVFELAKPPELGKVWEAQERLWVQGTLLDAIAKINGKSKNWDEAVVKQILMIDVGSPSSQDQKSMVKGDGIEAAPAITAGGGTEAAAPSEPGGGPGGPGGQGGTQSEQLYYVTSPATQFKKVPIQMTVLVDQSRLQEFFIGLENSPMTIQVLEPEILKPATPVVKPVKGEMPNMGFGPGGMGSGRFSRGSFDEGGAGPGAMFGPGGAGGGRAGRMMSSAGGGEPGGFGGAVAKGKSGIDNRAKDTKKQREAKEKARKEKTRGVDMYYDVVEVTVYGQARFYQPPPPPPATEPSASATAPADPGKPADASKAAAEDPGKPAPKAEEAKKDEAKPEEKKAADAPKKEEAKPADAPKKEEAKPAADAAKKAEETKPADATKPADPKPPGAPKG